MLSNLIPFLYTDKIENIDYEYLKSLNIKGLLFDLDNTLIATDVEIIPEEKLKFLKSLEKDFKVLIITNNTRTRMEIANQNNFPCVAKAGKPNKKGISQALEILELDKKDCVLIGDQLLSDIKGGNQIGMKTILVNPIDITKDGFWTKIQRMFERYHISRIKAKNEQVYNRFFKDFQESMKQKTDDEPTITNDNPEV